MIDRRNFLGSTAGLGISGMFWSAANATVAAAAQRMLLVVLRGAADGLSMVPPIGDPHLASLRGPWIDGGNSLLNIDSDFALASPLSEIAALYRAGEALVLHAVSTSYRERSHFDAQNILETGSARAYALRDGWMNRLVGLLGEQRGKAVAVAPTLPAALRGEWPVASYAPTALTSADDDMISRVAALYANDIGLQQAWSDALATQEGMHEEGMNDLRNATRAGELVAKLMAGPMGARLAMIDLPGWDTHARQPGRLQRNHGMLDALIAAYRKGMNAAWQDCLVIVVTEFGRTVAINGTGGTDHGTGGAGFLLGGRVKGGRVLTDWPGLASGQLLDGRDLRPTLSLEMIMAGAIAEHFGLEPEQLARALFPGRTDSPLSGLVG